jgi:signal transduction histidine kinase
MGVSPMSATGVTPVADGRSPKQHGRDGRATHGQDARATAIAILAGELSKDEYRAARDGLGRLVAPDALLAALRVTSPDDANSRKAIAQDLLARVNSYAGPAMPSSQRVFLMTELQNDIRVYWPTLEAEQLAAAYADDQRTVPAESGLARAVVRGLWALCPPDGGVVGLVTDHEVAAAVDSLGPDAQALAGARSIVHYGPDSGIAREPFLDVPASQYMPAWRLSLYLEAPDPFAAAAEQRNALYLWTGILGIAFIAIMATVMATYLGRQMRLTRLKNDLIATVSHELKTPLASMRVLVDTLREGRCTDEKQASEYFDLIAKENERLSRLIDNFLTFSRMERNKRAFDFAEVDVGDVLRAAADATGERFASPQSRLSVEVQPGLPLIRADRDAIETVILNLLDNAWKYSGDDKSVTLRALSAGGAVLIEVADNGVGLSRRAQRRIFDKFYQVDRTLARKAGGCGLGLAIVKFILDAHGGSIDVKSQTGKGSTFTIRLPAGKEEERLNAEHAEGAEKK